MSDTLNLQEASDYLKLGYQATKELFERGDLPGISLNLKHTLFLKSDLDDYIREKAREQQEARRRRAGIAAPTLMKQVTELQPRPARGSRRREVVSIPLTTAG